MDNNTIEYVRRLKNELKVANSTIEKLFQENETLKMRITPKLKEINDTPWYKTIEQIEKRCGDE